MTRFSGLWALAAGNRTGKVALGQLGEGGPAIVVEGEDLVEIGDLEDALQLLVEGTDGDLTALGLELGACLQQQT